MRHLSRLVGGILATTVALGGLAACSTGSGSSDNATSDTATSDNGTAGAVTDVQVSEAESILADPGITVVDVRTPAEFAAGHLPGAINIDLQGATFADDIAELPKDEAYFVYCQSGNRSGTATDHMADAGFTTVYDLQGGVADWQAWGGELVTD